MTIIPGEIIEVIADEGMMLTNDYVNFTDHLFLGKDDSPDNWVEVPIEEAPIDDA